MSVPSRSEPIGSSRLRPVSPGGAGHAQLARLFRLVMILQSERFPNARTLAAECEVCRRTIHRDLVLLEEAGVQVRYRPDKQGYELERGFFMPPTNLTETQAIALLVLARQWSGGDGLGLSEAARDGALKAVQALPAEVRDRVLTATEPFRAGLAPHESHSDRRGVRQAVLESLTRQRQLRLWYREAASLELECTKFGLYRLLLHQRHWYLVGRSSVQRKVVVIGLPWVERALVTEDRYTIPPRFNLERFLAQAWGVEKSPIRHQVWVRFSSLAAPLVLDENWHRGERRVELADGGLDLHLVVDGLDEVLRWVQGFGDQVQVLCPSELRKRLHEVATQIARLHDPAATVLPDINESA
jgi:predicted DNA-binding transcriptional regulator YafY